MRNYITRKLIVGDINNFGQDLLKGYTRGFAASGTGSRINNGTLMGAMMINNDNFSNPAAAVIVSTDNGYNWKVRSIAKRSGSQDEPKVVTQLNDGRILLSVRSGKVGNQRVWFKSAADVGSKWNEIKPKGNFYDGNCNAEGILFTSTKEGYNKNRLIHLALNSGIGRRNLTAFISYDEGDSWKELRVLNSGRSGYSALARLKDGTIVTLSEEQGGYGDLSVTGKELYHIVFRRFNLRWLTDMKYYYTPHNQALRRR